MLSVLRERTYRRLFSAQAVALIGTGLLTVALGLLAFDLAGSNAGAVMGTALTIKMLAYVGFAPVINALVARLPTKPVLIAADLVRAAMALCLPFITEAWQIYVVIFLLQSASATFTPAFQSLIPTVLTNERDYTHALSLSRLAYDMEALVSPAAAGLLLTLVSYNNLFLGTVFGFLFSAGMVAATALPKTSADTGAAGSLWHRTPGCPDLLGKPPPAVPARLEPGGRRPHGAGARQLGGLRPRSPPPARDRSCPGSGMFRSRVHDRGHHGPPRVGAIRGPGCDAHRRCLHPGGPGRGNGSDVPCYTGGGLVVAAGAVVPARRQQLHHPHPVLAVVAGRLHRGNQAVCLHRSVLPLARLLHLRLPVGWVARSRGWFGLGCRGADSSCDTRKYRSIPVLAPARHHGRRGTRHEGATR